MKIRPPPRFITVHILHDNTLSQGNRDKFNQIAGRYGQIIKFYNVEEKFPDKIEEIRKKFSVSIRIFSVASTYRLFLSEILPQDISKAIYLDSDTIVNLNINELWQIELGEKFTAAVPESFNKIEPLKHFDICKDGFVKPENYFNAGVLLINLEQLRNFSSRISDAINFIAEHPNFRSFDQDVLNYCFSDSSIKLSNKFNRFPEQAINIGENLTNKIYHFVGSSLKMNLNDEFSRLWFKYFSKTPWFNEKIFGNIYELIQQIYVWQKNFSVQISAIQANKSRAFFVPPQNIPAVKQIFSVNDSEEIIELVSDESIQNLIQSMKNSKGEKIFYIFANYMAVQNLLTQEGFIDGRDFINGLEFLSDANGFPLNSHIFVRVC